MPLRNRAAYEAAKQVYPHQRITLQEGARVLEDNRFTVIKGKKAG